eukprot:GFUD01026621.1.p1 GENE.GFUD01026621.1~~GFUD01026621.1.p1  ORF type:complete len:459 (+),score=149.64 GFUD01026621.1:40-1416(+)
MSGLILGDPHFYWSHCLCCHQEDTITAPLKRCSRCHAVSYCSPAHQRADWKTHKQLCTFLAQTAAETGQWSFFSSMEGSSQTDWSKFLTSSAMACSRVLGKSLSQQEKEIFLFPRSCQLSSCHSVTGCPDMVDCVRCLCVSYCSQEHQEEDKKSHTLGCTQLKLARLLDRHNTLVDIGVPSLDPHQDSKYLGTSKDIRGHLVQMEYDRLGLGPVEDSEIQVIDELSDEPGQVEIVMDFAFLTNQLSGPLTLLDIGHKFIPQFNTRTHLTVHLAGASMFEMLAMVKWEYLAHRLPALHRLEYVFVGPECGGEEGLITDIENCYECQVKGRNITYREFAGGYDQFKRTAVYSAPDIVLVQNCGFAEHGEKSAEWVDGWAGGLGALLDQGVVVAFTSYTGGEAVEDLERFLKYCGKEVEVLVRCEKNGMRSRRPVRDFEREDGGEVFYNNQIVSVVRAKKA